MSRWFTKKNTLVIASAMLAGYLLLILTVTNLGQNKLEESRDNELHLRISHYGELLSNYFKLAKHNSSMIVQDKAIITFFGNKSSGMSMTYGLGASLFNLRDLINKQLIYPQDKLTPVFSRLTLIELDQSIIADSENKIPFNYQGIDISYFKKSPQTLFIAKVDDDLAIRLSTTVYFHNSPIALLIAEFNKEQIISLLTALEYEGSGSHITLRSRKGDLFIWDSLDTASYAEKTHAHQDLMHSFHLKEEIIGAPFIIEAWFENINDNDLFTSKWFVVVISLLAIPVFLSLYYLFYIEHKNAQLHHQIINSKKRRKELSKHNTELECEIKKRQLSEQKLAYQATHDSLTGLPNRSYSLEKLNHAIAHSQRTQKKVLLMYIDLDNFKQVNDTLGHAAGDEILIETSRRLSSALRKTDTVARLSGDEFMVIINDLEGYEQATEIAFKMHYLFDQPFQIDKHLFHTSSSIGLAIYPDDTDNAETLLKCADMALYKVKGNGRKNFSFYEAKMNDEVNRKVAINLRLHAAIKENSLEMYYQPLINLKTQKIIGAEALMRWTDSELGFVPPDEFIAIAEKNNLIEQLGSFALNTAVHQAAKWQKITPMQIAVNFSSVQFRNCKQLLNDIENVLNTSALPPERLDVEVTESLIINQEGELFDMLQTLRSMGVELSIDDFGTGYSALSYLQKFAFTKLKIDRGFIMNLSENEADQSLVMAIVAMAKALNLKVVGEGIETKSQMKFLNKIDCEIGQGYLFSKPLPADQFEELLKDPDAIQKLING
ncbi:putative bifunctional diguanylate cyclase/phosphodiesterase [Psychromonas arctica]|uniref:putative bifunctional diguanylate cyclase/phosphodiesterase n=1 Tax=Psychromonas arctica TaxID=168275 RepID=UPI002FD0CFEA